MARMTAPSHVRKNGCKPAIPPSQCDSDLTDYRKKEVKLKMEFFMKMTPPTCTAQMKKISVVHGRPVVYETSAIKAAKDLLCSHLRLNRPAEPLTGPLELNVLWKFPRGKSHKHDEWRVTRPDTDNLEKMLKDCMTKCGYWNDDAQVVLETCGKKWSDEPCGIEIELCQLEDSGNV